MGPANLPLSAAVCALLVGPSFAGPGEANVVRGGICINEVLPDPTSEFLNFDIDGNGQFTREDEFVEVFNAAAVPIDISGLELWDEVNASARMFAFPADSILQPGAFAVVHTRIGPGGALWDVEAPNLAFDAALNTGGVGRIADSGENLALVDPATGEYVQVLWNNEAPVDFPTEGPPGFTGTTLLGAVENLGNDVDGTSVGRNPDGSATAGGYWLLSGNTLLATPGKPAPAAFTPLRGFSLY